MDRMWKLETKEKKEQGRRKKLKCSRALAKDRVEISSD